MRHHAVMIQKNIPDLDVLIERVADEATFLNFLEALSDDFARSPPSDFASEFTWVHSSVDAVFDASVAWGRNSSDPSHPGYRETNPWQRCACILLAAKYYE